MKARFKKIVLKNRNRNSKFHSLISAVLTLLLLPCFVVARNAIEKHPVKGYITINIQYKEAKPSDTITLIIDEILNGGSGIDHDNLGSYKSTGHNGSFHFRVPVQQACGYFDLQKARTFTKGIGGALVMTLMNTCFWEVGDHILIHLSHKEAPVQTYSTCSFSGKGAYKYQMDYLTDSILNATVVNNTRPAFDNTFRYFDYYPDKSKKALDLLEQNRKRLSNLSYRVLKANIIYRTSRDSRFIEVLNFYDQFIKNASPEIKERFRKRLNEQFAKNDMYGLGETALLNSRRFFQYSFYKFRTLSIINYDHDDEQLVFNLMKQQLRGRIRDKELIFLLLNYEHSSDLTQLYKEAHYIVRDGISSKILNHLIQSAPGNYFTDFTLRDTTGKMVSSSEFRGRVVLIDFWFRGCGACSGLYQNTLKETEHAYKEDKDVVFVSINCDPIKRLWLVGINEGIYTSSDAINLNTNGLGWNHPLFKSNHIPGFPFVVLLDKKGIIKYLNSADLYNYKGLKAAIESVE